MERFTGFLGIVVLLGIAHLISNNRKQINYKLVAWGLVLQAGHLMATSIRSAPGAIVVAKSKYWEVQTGSSNLICRTTAI